MKEFSYLRASDIAAVAAQSSTPETRILAGGTTLLDLMKCGVENPSKVIDITRLNGLSEIAVDGRRLHIGALAKMSHVAAHPAVQNAAPAITEALWQAASAQLRNMASIGGNLLQRTRCTYFRDPAAYPACNKRVPGSGCSAHGGINRNHAILGVSEACIATYPGDLAVALIAFDAVVHVQGNEKHQIGIDALYRLPGDRPDMDHRLSPGEIITAVEIPISKSLHRSHYLKVRDRASYEFAAASAAVGIEFEADGRTVRDLRVALGGVATKPWRAREVEAALIGKHFDERRVRSAALLAIEGATVSTHNGFKKQLVPKVVARALLQVGGVV
jgi:CO/xanthine dehydrogenase FAD-binding subunit